MRRHLPSIEALTAPEDDRWITELRLLEAREQLALAKELLDDLASREAANVAEELAIAGCRIVEIARLLAAK